MLDSVLKLIQITHSQAADGTDKKAYSSKEVFCQVNSITRQEYFDGGRSGLRPQYQFTVFAADYEGESMCAYNGQSYAIYRTYRPEGSDYIELYAQTEGGTNGRQNAGYV